MYKSYKDEVSKALKEAKERALEKVGLFVEGEAILRCPVDTGNLRSSISHKVVEQEDKVVIGTNVEYAIYVEKGTKNQSAQPYLTPSVEKNIKDIQKIVKEEMLDD